MLNLLRIPRKLPLFQDDINHDCCFKILLTEKTTGEYGNQCLKVPLIERSCTSHYLNM